LWYNMLMIIIIALVLLFILFFSLRKHTGPAHLAAIAGVSIYEAFGKELAKNLSSSIHTQKSLIEVIIFLVLVVVLPLILYFRSSRNYSSPFFRIIEALVFSALLVSLSAWCINYFIPFDNLSKNIFSAINSFKGIIMVVGLVFAYFDILFYRNSSSRY